MTRLLPVLLLAVTAGAAAAQRGRNAAAASLPQVECPGEAARATTFAVAAQQALNRTLLPNLPDRRSQFEQALQQSREGIRTYPENAHHYFLGGQGYAGLEDLAGADSMFARAEAACPGYAEEVAAARLAAWRAGFQRGLDAFQAGDTTGAIGQWERASVIDDRRADIFYNLGVVYGMRGDHARSASYYRQALEALDRTPDDTDGAVIQAEAETRANSLSGMLSAGASLFQAERFREAAGIFTQITRAAPSFRDAWYNHALALYKLGDWVPLVPIATRLTEMDPLNYNGRIVLFNAHKGISEAARARGDSAAERESRLLALRTLEAADALPVQVDGIRYDNSAGSVRVSGAVTGAAAPAGTPIRLDFTLLGITGPVGSGSVTVAAPARGQRTDFQFDAPASAPVVGASYRLAGS